MPRLSNERRKRLQSLGAKDTSNLLAGTKSYIRIGELRENRKRERFNRKINRSK